MTEVYVILNKEQEKAIAKMRADYVVRGTLVDKSIVVTLGNGVKITIDEKGQVIKSTIS